MDIFYICYENAAETRPCRGHPCRAALSCQMAGGAGCSSAGCDGGSCLALQRQRSSQALNTETRQQGGAAPNGVSSSLLPHRAAFIPALGVGFEGFLWSPWIRLCHHSSLPELQFVLSFCLIPSLPIILRVYILKLNQLPFNFWLLIFSYLCHFSLIRVKSFYQLQKCNKSIII